jgi:amidase
MTDPVDRRAFLGAGLAAGVAGLATLPPRGVAAAAENGAPDPFPPPPPSFELDELGIAELGRGLAAERWTSSDLVALLFERIEAIDSGGPGLRSVVETNPDAPGIAAELDRERREKGPRGPLHGIPIVIKDNIDSADRMKTTAGSLALAGSTPPRDAGLVERLRAAGAILLGKTNLSEWANIRGHRSTSGWSARGGLTRNPYALDRNTSGSSSGTAAAVSASLAAAGIGTETDGSILSPASTCGLVGLKPTVGLVGRSGIIPISSTQDTAGPIARSVADAAFLLAAIAGSDPRDPATKRAEGMATLDPAKVLDRRALAGARIGVARNLAGFHPGVDEAFERALAALRGAGAILVDPANPAHLGKFDDSELEVLLTELKAGLAAYFASLGPAAPVRTLADVIEFDRKNRERELRWFGQELFEQAEGKGPLEGKPYREALALCRRLAEKEGLEALFAKHRLDALVAPTNGPAWTTDLVNGDAYGGGNTSYAAVAGWPSLTVPMGQLHGLPLGISFTSRPWTEGRLLGLGFAFEQTTNARRPPRFLRTIG